MLTVTLQEISVWLLTATEGRYTICGVRSFPGPTQGTTITKLIHPVGDELTLVAVEPMPSADLVEAMTTAVTARERVAELERQRDLIEKLIEVICPHLDMTADPDMAVADAVVNEARKLVIAASKYYSLPGTSRD